MLRRLGKQFLLEYIILTMKSFPGIFVEIFFIEKKSWNFLFWGCVENYAR